MKLILKIASLLTITSLGSYGQTAITASKIDTTSTTSGITYNRSRAHEANSGSFSSTSDYQYKFGDNSGSTDNVKTLKSFTAGGAGYTYLSGITTVVKIRRVENASFNTYWSGYGSPETTPTPRDLAYYESEINGNTIKIKAPYTPKMEDLFQSNNIAIGIDNLFANDYVTNFNNVERIDVIIPAGLQVQVPASQGFAIFERGVYNQHDPSTLALITAIDGNGKPTAYATSIVRVGTEDYYDPSFTTNSVYQPSNFTNGSWAILRRDSSNAKLRASDKVSLNQGIGGVMIKFSDFGIAPGTTVYGYSILAGDFPASGTGANAVDYTNSTYFPTNTSGGTMDGGNDMSVITGVVKILSISGKVFHDPNGLTDNNINGNGIGKPSGTQLYVNMVDANGKVVGVATVDPVTGTFLLEQLAFGPLTARLSTVQGVVGQGAPASGLPAGWSSVGENYGNNNLAGNGNEGGVSNSIIPVSVGDKNISEVNFGIQGAPVADPKSFTIPQPYSGQSFVLNGSSTLNQLTGTDPEDAPEEQGLNGSGNNRTVVITSLPTNGELWYNGAKITTPGFTIPNYNKNLLSLKLTGTGYTGTSFNYAYRDAASTQSTPATYNVSWLTPLPVTLLSFSADLVNSEVRLNWRTATEQNNKGFVMERSADGKYWKEIGFQATLAPNGNSNTELSYDYIDKQPLQGFNYYRLKQTDIDNKSTYSGVQQIYNNLQDESLVIYPNPASDKIYFKVKDWSSIKEVRITDMNGRLMQRSNKAEQGLTLSMPTGMYHVQVVYNNGVVTTHKLSKQ